MFIGKYNKSVILTYIGLVSSIIGIFSATNSKIKYAIICLLISGICDLFDGKIARMCNRNKEEKEFGVQIDSLVDLISFAVLPTIIFYNMGFNNYLNITIYVVYVLCAVIRLAYFNVVTADINKSITYYSGLPVTTTAFIYPLLWLVIETLNFQNKNIIYSVIMLLTALLFIINFKIKKTTGKSYIWFTILVVLTVILIILK